MLGRIIPLLEERARQAGMTVRLAVEPGAAEVRATADEAGVGQVLFNLVDNACKYADSGPNRRIEVSLRTAAESGFRGGGSRPVQVLYGFDPKPGRPTCRRGGAVEIGVSDFGPGPSAVACRRPGAGAVPQARALNGGNLGIPRTWARPRHALSGNSCRSATCCAGSSR